MDAHVPLLPNTRLFTLLLLQGRHLGVQPSGMLLDRSYFLERRLGRRSAVFLLLAPVIAQEEALLLVWERV